VSARITDTAFINLVGHIYDAAIDPTRWPEFLSRFANAIGGENTLMFSQNLETFEATMAVQSEGLNAAVNFDPDFLRSYDEHYSTTNVWVQNEVNLPAGVAVTGPMLYPEKELRKTEFYNDWLRPQNVFHVIGGVVARGGAWALKFSSLRPHRAGNFTSDELRLYQLLMPHVARAAHIQRRYRFLAELSRSSLAILDTVPAAVLLLDASSRLLHANTSGDAELRRADPFKVTASGELNLRGAVRGHAAVRNAISAALDPVRAMREKLAPVAQIRRRNGEPLSVQAIPLPKRDRVLALSKTNEYVPECALVIHGDRTPIPRVGPQLLRHVYGLTHAEVQIALAIADGETPKAYAERRGISKNTVATQLKSTFSKTGLKRQSELVRWLLLCGAARRPGAV
jgi:DNA-binding CsgD family transcriptional regulator